MAHNSVDFTCCGAPNPEVGPLLGVRCPSPRPAPRERGISNSSRKRGAENAYVGRSPSISLSIRLMHTTCERAGKTAKNVYPLNLLEIFFPCFSLLPFEKGAKVTRGPQQAQDATAPKLAACIGPQDQCTKEKEKWVGMGGPNTPRSHRLTPRISAPVRTSTVLLRPRGSGRP